MRANVHRNTWRDWKGDLVLPPFFGYPLPRTKVPAELASEAALLNHLGLSTKELKKIWWFREKMYNHFNIAKGNGKIRVISAPDVRLKYLQRQLAPLLASMYRVRNPVHGFVPAKSVKTNAQAHLRRRFLLNMDLKDFFPSITEKRISGVLASLGVDHQAASIIARLCCCSGRLPQGAPTSPVLSNMVCFKLDKELMALAKNARCIYTRYADDITFSSHQPMTALFVGPLPSSGHFSVDLLGLTLLGTVSQNGFAVNPEKAHYADRHSRRMVTGLKVNEFVNVDRRYVRNIRATLYSVETLGLKEAQEKFETKHKGIADLAQHLKGKISWLGHIRGQADPVFRAIANRFNKSFSEQPIALAATGSEVRDRAVWVVEHYEGEMSQGSAFFLKDVGLVTAAHCVSTANEIEIYHPSKQSNKFKVSVHRVHAVRDVALLKHSIPATEYFELERSTQSVATGDELTALGYPSFGPGDGINVRSGKVTSLPVKHAVKHIEVEQQLAQGMSGGPVVDADGAVLGVVHKGGPDEARNLAVNIDELYAWLAEPKS